MTIDKKTLKTILRQARTLHKEESKADDLLRAYFKQVSPKQHSPFIERNMVHGYMQAIEDIYGEEMRDHVSYWVYEVPDMAKQGKVECTDQNGKHYDASNLGSYVNFILAL